MISSAANNKKTARPDSLDVVRLTQKPMRKVASMPTPSAARSIVAIRLRAARAARCAAIAVVSSSLPSSTTRLRAGDTADWCEGVDVLFMLRVSHRRYRFAIESSAVSGNLRLQLPAVHTQRWYHTNGVSPCFPSRRSVVRCVFHADVIPTSDSNQKGTSCYLNLYNL